MSQNDMLLYFFLTWTCVYVTVKIEEERFSSSVGLFFGGTVVPGVLPTVGDFRF
jgi:hypothetical protein